MNKKIVVFASGSGSNFQAILNAIDTGKLKAIVSGLVVNHANVAAIKKATDKHIPVYIYEEKAFQDNESATATLIQTVLGFGADLIVLAGYLKKIPSKFIEVFHNRILNIHPSLLPKYGGAGFYGIKVHQAVLANNEQITGCTIHIVTDEYDEGPIVAQKEVAVLNTDTPETLAARVLEQEHQLYAITIQEYLNKI